MRTLNCLSIWSNHIRF